VHGISATLPGRAALKEGWSTEVTVLISNTDQVTICHNRKADFGGRIEEKHLFWSCEVLMVPNASN
jgi:hypothetical protein